MNGQRKRGSGLRAFLAAVLLLTAGLGAAAAWLWQRWNTPYRGYSGGGVFVEIPRGTSSAAIARILAQSGVVESHWQFEVLCRMRRTQQLQAGEYRFERPMTPLEVFQVLAEGRIYFRSVTIPEGWTMFEIARFLQREGFGAEKDFLEAAADTSAVRGLAPAAATLEGFLFPATYQFTRRATPRMVVQAMTGRFQQLWSRLPRNAELRLTPAEAVTLASLVEREARVPEERALIAGVYMNRLKKGMALQCDPTVVYALELAGKWDGRIGYADLRFKSPYNTYLHRGLPPGPIANPGEASLRAALNPAATDYLYFVADTHGRHFFSRTLEEHNRNVRKYLRLLSDARRQKDGGAARGNGRPSGKTQ